MGETLILWEGSTKRMILIEKISEILMATCPQRSLGRQPLINIWEAARYMEGGSAHQSALKDGERLQVPDWGDAPE